jgi:hypothetical protein
MTKVGRRLRACAAALGLAACGTLAAAGAASATTIGANAPLLVNSSCGVTADQGLGDVWYDTAYAAPGGGQITSFAFQNDGRNAGNILDFVALRSVGTGRWAVVGRTGANTLAADSALDSFTPPHPVLVAPGDIIGFFFPSLGDTTGAILHDCLLSTTGVTNVADSPNFRDPGVGTVLTDVDNFSAGRLLNLSAQLDQSLAPDIYGGGVNAGRPVNTFTVTALSTDGVTSTLTYSDNTTNRVFNGVVDCVNRVGNAATIVAHDPATGFKDRTYLQDGGASGDKIINTLWNPATHTAKFNARTSVCGEPNTVALARHAAVPGDEIHFAPPPGD